MRKIYSIAICFVTIATMLISCEANNNSTSSNDSSAEDSIYNYDDFDRWHGFRVRVIDSCEYIIRADHQQSGHAGWGFGFMSHKGNCRFCKERREREKQSNN